jgi:enolase
VAKYNRLLLIEVELGADALYGGRRALPVLANRSAE